MISRAGNLIGYELKTHRPRVERTVVYASRADNTQEHFVSAKAWEAIWTSENSPSRTFVNKGRRRGGGAGHLPSDGPRSLLAPTHQGGSHEPAGE